MVDQYELVADAMYALRMIVSGRSSESVGAKVEELVLLLEDAARQLPPVSGIPQNELALEVARGIRRVHRLPDQSNPTEPPLTH